MKDKKNLKLLISIVLTIFLIISALVPAGVVLQDKFSTNKFLDRQNIQEFYSLEKNTIDLLCIGSSQIMNGFVAGEVYGKYGITAYGLGTCSQPVYAAYHWLLEAEKYQSPKMILLEVSRIYGKNVPLNYVKAFTEMKNTSSVKWKALQGLDLSAEDFLTYYSDVYAFHSRFSELVKDDYAYLMGTNKHTYLGAALSERLFSEYNLDYDDFAIDSSDASADAADEENLTYFKKIVDYCKERNIELVLFKTTKEDWNEGHHAGIKVLADEYGLDFIDLNLKEAIDEIGFDFEADFIDPEHYNYYGAVKATDYVAKFIAENYDLPDRREGENFIESYEKKYQEYCHAVDNIKLNGSETLDEILKYIDNDKYVYAIAKRGDVKFTPEQYEKLNALGFTADFIGHLNAVFVKSEGKVVVNEASDKKLVEKGMTSNFRFYNVEASGGEVKTKVPYAATKISDDDGISISVFDTESKRAVLEITFDVNLK